MALAKPVRVVWLNEGQQERQRDTETQIGWAMGVSFIMRTAPFWFLLVGPACSAWGMVGLELGSERGIARAGFPHRESPFPGPPLIHQSSQPQLNLDLNLACSDFPESVPHSVKPRTSHFAPHVCKSFQAHPLCQHSIGLAQMPDQRPPVTPPGSPRP